MTVSELQSACRARGMRALGVPEARLKSQLSQASRNIVFSSVQNSYCDHENFIDRVNHDVDIATFIRHAVTLQNAVRTIPTA